MKHANYLIAMLIIALIVGFVRYEVGISQAIWSGIAMFGLVTVIYIDNEKDNK